LTSIIIPDSVTSIGKWAFSNNQLTSVTISNSITSIEEETFQNNQLTNITIPDSVTNIGSQAFDDNQITSITIGSSVTIHYYLALPNDFYDSYYAQRRKAGTYTYYGQVKEKMTTHYDKERNETFTWLGHTWTLETEDGFTVFENYQGGNTITEYNGEEKQIVIPEVLIRYVTKIEEKAFFAKELTGVTLPGFVEYIGDYAFADNQLTSITIPNSVTEIGIMAFAGNKLTSITIGNSVTTIGTGAFPNNFASFYFSQGKKAGTYTWDGKTWTVK